MSLFFPSLVVLICALSVGALFFAGRFLRLRGRGRSEKAPCRLVASLDLSPQHVLYVVETADKRLLLGGAPGGLSLLTELPRPPAAATGTTSRERELLDGIAKEMAA